MPPEFRQYVGTYMGGAIQLVVGFFFMLVCRLDVVDARRRARVADLQEVAAARPNRRADVMTGPA